MGNQHTHAHHPPSYYSIEYLNGSTGTSVPDIILNHNNNDYTNSATGSLVEQSFRQHHNHEYQDGDIDDVVDDEEEEEEEYDDDLHQVTLSTIVQPTVQNGNNKTCTIQRSKSYVRPENRVLPHELPTKPLRKTNYLKTEGYKRTWRHKSSKKHNEFMADIANYSHASMPEDLHKVHYKVPNSDSESEWQRPSSIAAISDRRHIMENEIKKFRDKYSRSMDNLEEWTMEDTKDDSTTTQTTKQNLYKKLFNINIEKKTSKQPHQHSVSFDVEKKNKSFKIDPVRVQPLTCSPNQKSYLNNNNNKKAPTNGLSRPPHSTSTPTPRVDQQQHHHPSHDISFAISDATTAHTKYSDKNSGILVKKTRSGRSKHRNEVRKSVEFSFENDKIEHQQKENIVLKRQAPKAPPTNETPPKSDTLSKAKALLLQSRRRQIMEQSINESLDLQDAEDKRAAAAATLKKGKLKSKSFLHADSSSKSKTDSIKSKFGIRSVRSNSGKKKDERVKAIDLERDIQIISRFPINSKVYRHYIAGGSASDKLTNSYNAAKMVRAEDSNNYTLDCSDFLNERAIDVNNQEELEKSSAKDDRAVIDTINQVFDPIYDSIDEYQSKNTTAITVKSIDDVPMKSTTTSFKPIAKVNPTSNNSAIVKQQQQQQQQQRPDISNQHKFNDSDNEVTPSFQARISKFNEKDNIQENTNSSSSTTMRYAINSHVNRKCSMSSEKLEPILEGTPNKNSILNAKRKSAIGVASGGCSEAANNQRLNEKLQNEIQRAYEERTKRFNQVKMALRSNSILSNSSYHQIFQSASPSRTVVDNQDEIMIRLANNATNNNNNNKQIISTTNRINERQIVTINNNNNNSPLPSPPSLTNNKLQYSVSSCSSVTLPPPPPPPPLPPPLPPSLQQQQQQQQLNYVESIIKDMRNLNHNHANHINNNVNENEVIINKHRLVNNNNNNSKPTTITTKLHHQQQEQEQYNKNALNCTSKLQQLLLTTTTSSSSTSSNSSSTSSSLSTSNSYSKKYYSSINNNKNDDDSTIIINKHQQQQQQEQERIKNIFDTCTNELVGMDENFTCKYKSANVVQRQEKAGEGENNFILKSKPTLSSEYTCSNNSYQVSYDGYKETSKDNNNNNASKSMAKNRRRGLDEVFPALKDAIQDAQNHVQILNITEKVDTDEEYGEEVEEDEDENEKNYEFKTVEKAINKFRIDDPDWCPASDLGDFEFDDYELRAIKKNENNMNNLDEERPRKKTKHSTSFLTQNTKIKDEQQQQKLIAKPIPIHMKSTATSLHSAATTTTSAAPIFSKIQTKLSSFENSYFKASNTKQQRQRTAAGHTPPPPITKCKFEITLYPFNIQIASSSSNNNNHENTSRKVVDDDNNDYDCLYYDDKLETTSTTVASLKNNNYYPTTPASQYVNEKPMAIKTTTMKNNSNQSQSKSMFVATAYKTTLEQQQKNYRRLIKMKDAIDDASSDDEKTLNAEIRKQNWQTCLQRANTIQSNSSNRMPIANPNYCYRQQIQKPQQQQPSKSLDKDYDEVLDALLYETDRKSSGGTSDGKRNPIYYSSSSESVYSNLI